MDAKFTSLHIWQGGQGDLWQLSVGVQGSVCGCVFVCKYNVCVCDYDVVFGYVFLQARTENLQKGREVDFLMKAHIYITG